MENKSIVLFESHKHLLEENRDEGSLGIPRSVFERYTLIEWLEFEKLFLTRAQELGYGVEIEVNPFSYRTYIRWRRQK